MQPARKETTRFVCGQCGFASRKWLGRCPDCGAWDSLAEERQVAAARPGRPAATVQPLVAADGGEEGERLVSGIAEMDRVLGGGIVPGSLVLIGGDPGIGKSTLILQLLSSLAARQHQVLYVTGEESVRQIRMRAGRLAIGEREIFVSTENCVEAVVDLARQLRPALLAVDSIQTVFSEAVGSAPGSVTQVREATARLLQLAKSTHLPILLVGHVTKDGAIAGPRVLEHMVDTVLYFEGDRGQVFRILRTVKNRFGSTNEIGVFEMKEQGLQAVANPSALFLDQRDKDAAGSAVFAGMEGTRPVLCEIQALVAPSPLGTPRRAVVGWDSNRLSMLLAVLEARCGISLATHDVYLNVAGGLKIAEPAADLAAAAALLSSFSGVPLQSDHVFFGEISLSGAVRAASHMMPRLKEAQKLGFAKAFMPEAGELDAAAARIAVERIGRLKLLADRIGACD